MGLAVVPIEIQLPSLRVAVAEKITDDQNTELRLQAQESLDKNRLAARQSIKNYQDRMASSFDKKVRERAFKKGDLVLAVRRPMILTRKSKEKFEPKWEGPYVIDKVYSNGANAILTIEGERCMMPINGKFLRHYYS